MYTQIHAWLNRTHPLPRRFAAASIPDNPDHHWLVWAGIQDAHLLHKAADLDWRTLFESSEIARKYVTRACTLLGTDQVEDLDDKHTVTSALGPPPAQATPLYIVSVGEATNERVVYIGKTVADTRFSGGHAAALKLHNPIYSGMKKTIYRCSVTVLLESDHVALEWVDPPEVAEQILDDVESRLIFALKPELNSKKTINDCAKNKCAVHVHQSACWPRSNRRCPR
jgi:hypothetical protein